MVQLLKLDQDTTINADFILQITIENLNQLRRRRDQHHETPQQRERMRDLYWEVSVYLRSGNDGYNPQRYTKRFRTQQEAQQWVNTKFGGAIINNL